MNPAWYGVLAEIGAGQEVARWFFRVGAAAGTIAKSISAYDMTISDATYGKADRQASNLYAALSLLDCHGQLTPITCHCRLVLS